MFRNVERIGGASVRNGVVGREAQGREEKVVLTTLRLRGGGDLGGEVFKVLERLRVAPGGGPHWTCRWGLA